MNNDEFATPKTYEEAIERKKEILEILNKYNEDILLNNPTTLTDEQVERLREEYEILDENYLVEEEKQQIDAVSLTKKKALLTIGYFLYVGAELFLLYYRSSIYIVGALLTKFLELTGFSYPGLWLFFVVIGVYSLLNLLVTFIIYISLKPQDTKKIMLITLIGHGSYFLINYGYLAYLIFLKK